jgi:hypothetical protein
MPCFTIQETKVDLGKVNADLLKVAMAALGVTDYEYNPKAGKVTMRGQSLSVDEIRHEYTKQVVLSQAKRFGWTVKQSPNGKITMAKARL